MWTTNNDININPPVKNVHHRFFKAVPNQLQKYIKTKARLSLVAIAIVDTVINQLYVFLLKFKDLAWLILRYKSSTDQIFAGWKNFFYDAEHQTIDKYAVAYLLTINKLSSKMDIVQEVLCQGKKRAEALNLKETDLVSFHAIYGKAVEIMKEEVEEKLTLNHLPT